MGRIAYSYKRLSSRSQVYGDSLARQTRDAKALCEKHGWTLDTSLNLDDLGIPSWHGENKTGALGLFLDAIGKQVTKGSVLICESMDRLSREGFDKGYSELFRQIILAGVDIATTKPERIYTAESLRDIGSIIELMVILERAREESDMKSYRVGKAWSGKRETVNEEKLTAKCPSWLRLSQDKKTFERIPGKVKVVKQIFAWCIEGFGVYSIVKKLNANGIPSLSYWTTDGIKYREDGSKVKPKAWQASSIKRILRGREVIGDYAMHIGSTKSHNRKFLKAIPDYYPTIISENQFHIAQNAIMSRTTVRGPSGTNGISNLFTGLIFNERDESMVLNDKGYGKQLVSSKAVHGSSPYLSFPYDLVEDAILKNIAKVKINKVAEESDLEPLEKRIRELDSNIGKIQRKIEHNPDIESLLDALIKLETQKKSAVKDLETLKIKNTNNDKTALKEIQILNPKDNNARQTIKSRIRGLLKKITLKITKKGKNKSAKITLVFARSGLSLDLAFIPVKYQPKKR